eukprot:scaffold13589_cov64-Phaeocystis_antarctica.AAC.7
MRCAGIGTKAGERRDAGGGGPVTAAAQRRGDGALTGSVTACGRPTPLACGARGVSTPRGRAAAARSGELAALAAGSTAIARSPPATCASSASAVACPHALASAPSPLGCLGRCAATRLAAADTGPGAACPPAPAASRTASPAGRTLHVTGGDPAAAALLACALRRALLACREREWWWCASASSGTSFSRKYASSEPTCPCEVVLFELLTRLAFLLGASLAEDTGRDAVLVFLGQPQPAALCPFVYAVVLAVPVGLPSVAAEPAPQVERHDGQRQGRRHRVHALDKLDARHEPRKLPLGVGVLLDARVGVAHHRDEQVDEQHVGDHDVHPQQDLAALPRPLIDVARLEPAEHRPQRRGVPVILPVGLWVGQCAEGHHEAADEEQGDEEPEHDVADHRLDHDHQYAEAAGEREVLHDAQPAHHAVEGEHGPPAVHREGRRQPRPFVELVEADRDRPQQHERLPLPRQRRCILRRQQPAGAAVTAVTVVTAAAAATLRPGPELVVEFGLQRDGDDDARVEQDVERREHHAQQLLHERHIVVVVPAARGGRTFPVHQPEAVARQRQRQQRVEDEHQRAARAAADPFGQHRRLGLVDVRVARDATVERVAPGMHRVAAWRLSQKDLRPACTASWITVLGQWRERVVSSLRASSSCEQASRRDSEKSSCLRAAARSSAASSGSAAAIWLQRSAPSRPARSGSEHEGSSPMARGVLPRSTAHRRRSRGPTARVTPTPRAHSGRAPGGGRSGPTARTSAPGGCDAMAGAAWAAASWTGCWTGRRPDRSPARDDRPSLQPPRAATPRRRRRRRPPRCPCRLRPRSAGRARGSG